MQGMRDVFIAVFFVSIGMLLNPTLLLKNWVLILSLGFVTILVRTFALSASLLITGTSDRDAFRAALMVTPIGEFAFIIAQLGVSAGMLSADYYPIAVGIALFTALISPVLIRHSGPISDVWLKAQPKFFYNLLELYQQFLASVGEHQRQKPGFRSCQAQLSAFGDQRHLRIRHSDRCSVFVRAMEPAVPGKGGSLVVSSCSGR